MRKAILKYLIVGCLILLPTTVTESSKVYAQVNRAPLRIGMITSLSGPLKSFGTQTSNGMKLALEQFKEQNKELAPFVRLKIKDDQSLLSKAEEVAKDLVRSRSADVFIGPLTSTATLVVSPAIEASGKPLVTATETSIAHNGSNSHFFRSPASDPHQAALLAQFTFETLGKKKIAIIYQKDSQYSRQMKQSYEKEFRKLGGYITATEFFVEGVSDFTANLAKIKKQKPGAVFAPIFASDAARVVTQAKKVGLTTTFVGVTSWDSPKLHAAASKAAISGHYFPAHFSIDDPDERIQSFVLSYRRRFGQIPNVYAAMGYDALLLITEAYKRANTSRTNPFEKSLANISFASGLYDTPSMDSQRNTRRAMSIRKTTSSGSIFYGNMGAVAKQKN